jgi:hypothetical protein
VGITVGSREVPGRKGMSQETTTTTATTTVTTNNNNNNNNNKGKLTETGYRNKTWNILRRPIITTPIML